MVIFKACFSFGCMNDKRDNYQMSQKRPAFERILLPEYISNDILQYLIE